MTPIATLIDTYGGGAAAALTHQKAMTVPAGTQCLLAAVACSFDASTAVLNSLTYGGTGLTILPDAQNPIVRSTANRLTLAGLLAPTIGSSLNLTATLAAAARACMTLYALTGVPTDALASIFGDIVNASGAAGSSPAGLATPSTAGDLVLDFLTHTWQDTDAVVVGAGSGQTELARIIGGGTGSSSLRLVGSSKVAAGVSTLMDWDKTGGNSGWAQISLAVKGAAAAASVAAAAYYYSKRRSA